MGRAQASAVGHLNVVAPLARVESHHPIRVCVTDGSNGVQFHVDGSTLGFVPIVICGLTTHHIESNQGLWIRTLDHTLSGVWIRVDQHSQYATDYWQTNYVRDTDSYEIIFN